MIDLSVWHEVEQIFFDMFRLEFAFSTIKNGDASPNTVAHVYRTLFNRVDPCPICCNVLEQPVRDEPKYISPHGLPLDFRCHAYEHARRGDLDDAFALALARMEERLDRFSIPDWRRVYSAYYALRSIGNSVYDLLKNWFDSLA
jgi:hypothetical protein